jgi:hypothetical protein
VSKDEFPSIVCSSEVFATPSYVVKHHTGGVPEHDAERSPHLTINESAVQNRQYFGKRIATYLPHHNQRTSHVGRRTLRRVNRHRRTLRANSQA